MCFGANGGSAGPGGVIDVTNNATIATLGDESVALMAQSHGGGGGNGGTAFGAFYAEGGSGGYGGAGGDVTVDNSAKLSTAGNDATGLYAQSIGGSGGDGGSTVAMYSFGGNGGSTSAGGDVTVTNSAAINAGDASLAPGGVPATGTDPTCGTGCSHGIFAQSVGGGGGGSGASVGVYSIGGSGGGGGAGGVTKVTNTANITTHLDQSKGILAHSVGGGGGHGGGSVAVSAGVALAIGGSGGSGGNGNAVTVNSSGATIKTAGDSSHAVSAQSVGGGGGHGGFAISLAVGVDDFPVGAISVGGTGGSGGSADTVTVNIPDPETGGGPSSLVTTGDGSHGLVAQSIGGGGGDGGFAISVAGGDAGSAAFAIGGKGKNAGHGAAVTVDSDAAISTSGDNSLGLYAQSIGGGGGHGGFAASGAFNFGEAGAVALSFGGSGGGGGSASTVDVTNSGSVGTTGNSAHALVAQSISGGGGNGGLTLSGTFSPTDDSFGAALSFGGSGGSGGTADTVTLDNTGALTTNGNMSSGIIAQSIGGGGGNGSMALSGTVQGPDGMSAAVTHGGTGGDGGDGGAVSVTNTAVIVTGNPQDPSDPADATTSNSHGIVAQSIGGGGGNGGLAGSIALGAGGESQTYNVGVAVGGSGGEGGKGGTVYVAETQYSTGEPLTTYSEQSYGVFAQSIGGGGGNGGSGISGTIELGSSMESSTVNASIAVGGKGGAGQTGGHVELYTDNVFTTYVYASHAIYLSSIGGGGGTGGSVKTLAYNLKCVNSDGSDCNSDDDTDGNNYNVNIGIGGNGGTGNDGGQVVINSVNSIHTHGDGATAIYAQSIGGGGGDGGDASGINTGELAKEERTKNTTKAVLYVGGTGAGGGNGGYVNLNEVNGTLTTEGVNSPAIFAQSIGGGGGKGGTGITSTTNKSTLTFGGSGGAAGDGGTVVVQYADLSITTGVAPTTEATDDSAPMPDSSYGIFAQSVGGGGGSAGNPCLAGKCNTGNTAEDIAIGVARSWLENGGNPGNGGSVIVQSYGGAGDFANITTFADNAIALFAQSVGGGGGTAGTTGISMADGEITGSIWGSTGGAGFGGPVTVDHAGAISTIGDGATGIFAQSAGGTGTSAGADVTVSVDGSVIVSGTDASAIFAQSVMLNSSGAAIGAGSSHVTVAAGSTVKGGTAGDIQSGAGVEIRDGVSNTVTNNGTITSAGGNAIVYVGSGTCEVNGSGSCQTSVSNTGLIDGNVLFGGPGGGKGERSTIPAGSSELSSMASPKAGPSRLHPTPPKRRPGS